MGGLNTLQLTWALRKHAQTDSQFVGVFARDELSLIIDQIPAIIIANTDPSTKSGSHWILFYFDNNGNVEYFDSLGKTLTHYHNVTSTVFESKDEPAQMTKQSFTIIYFITYKRTIHFKLICKNVHS